MRIDVNGLVVHVEPTGKASMRGIGFRSVAVANVVVVLISFWDLAVGQ